MLLKIKYPSCVSVICALLFLAAIRAQPGDDQDGSATPDPHFRTWDNVYYDYQGGCTLVLFKNSNWECHIATQNFGGYSGIIRSVCQTPNGNTIDVDALGPLTGTPLAPTVRIDGVVTTLTATPIFVDGYPLIKSDSSYYYQIDLMVNNGGYIRWTLHGGSLGVTASGSASNFGGSLGMLGDFDNGGVADRSGNPYTLVEYVDDAFAMEWEVGVDDASLITAPGFVQTGCTDSSSSLSFAGCIVGTGQDTGLECGDGCPDGCLTEMDAAEECAEMPDGPEKDNCMFDVQATGLVGVWGMNAPWNFDDGSPPEIAICSEVDNACTSQGGECVFQCEESSGVTCDSGACGGQFVAEQDGLVPSWLRLGNFRICFNGTTTNVGLFEFAINFIIFILIGWWTGLSSLSACASECACRVIA